MKQRAAFLLTCCALLGVVAWAATRTRPAPALLSWRDGGRHRPGPGWATPEWWQELSQPDGGVVWLEDLPLDLQTPGPDRGSRILVLPDTVANSIIRDVARSDDGRRVAIALGSVDGRIGLLTTEDAFGSASLSLWQPAPTMESGVQRVALTEHGWHLEFWVPGGPVTAEYWSSWERLRARLPLAPVTPSLPTGLYALDSDDFGRSWSRLRFLASTPP